MLRFSVILVLLPALALGSTEIPAIVEAGAYSVHLQLPDGPWSVRVYEKAQIIQYAYSGDSALTPEVFSLTIYRVGIPEAKLELDAPLLASALVKDDALNFHRFEFGKHIQIRDSAKLEAFPAGRAFIYIPESPVFSDVHSHYAAIALLFPDDYKRRKIAFLVVGHQIGSATLLTHLQDKFLYLILGGLREKKEPPEPTR